MPYEVKMRKMMSRKACKAYLKPYNKAHTHKSFVKSLIYKGKYVSLMCPELAENKQAIKENVKLKPDSGQTIQVHSKLSCSSGVILQTLLYTIRHGKTEKQVRMLLDSGHQRSNVLEKPTRELDMTFKGKLQLCHLLLDELKQSKDHINVILRLTASIIIRLYALKFWGIARSANVYLDYRLVFSCPN